MATGEPAWGGGSPHAGPLGAAGVELRELAAQPGRRLRSVKARMRARAASLVLSAAP